MWSPVTLADGGTRRNASVLAINALVIDVDGDAKYETVKNRLAGHDWIAYSTFSHTPQKQRFHVVVKLPQAIPADQWGAFYDGLKSTIAQGDNLRAVSHSYYVPQHRPGTAYFVERSVEER